MILTDSAAARIKFLLAQEGDPTLNVRAFVSGGGCSGFQYGFTFDKEQNEDDFVIESNDAKVLVDALSMQYMQDATIDFVTDANGERFAINNPQAVTTCGCGSSFSV